MGVIKRLSESLANKIAAGEVVERPASVVKELVENAIDAEAGSVKIEVEEGGLKTIKVTDNGRGFASEDCLIAFERHATSKIHNDSDLFHIHTLGFRGEALPSIAAVSYLELKTSDGENPGTHLLLQGGHLIQSGIAESRKGTEIKVSRLFYNTPARLKYLKSIHTELGRITDVVNRMALSYPSIRFSLVHEGKTVFQTNGSGELSHVLSAIYGIRTAKAAIPFSGDSLDFHVEGLAVHPQISRAGRQYVYIFVNNRYIRNYPIFGAIMEGYHTLTMIGRYPICVIHIKMDPSLIDVNVHPAKLEARISKERDLCALVTSIIRSAFHRERLIPSVSTRKNPEDRPQSAQQAMNFSPGVVTGPDFSAEGKTSPEEIGDFPPSFAEPEQVRELDQSAFSVEKTTVPGETAAASETTDNDEILPPSPDALPAGREPQRRMPKLYPIGQMHGTYIFAQNEDGLYIIDQHAAQERIKYEYYREKVGENTREVQELLVPMTFEFTAAEYETVQEYRDYLDQIGLHFESFGDRTLIIRSHPTWMPKGREPEMIGDIVQQLKESGKISIKKLREKLAMTMSCKRSIKANHYLRPDEIEALLDSLSRAHDPFTCPHGRPVLVHFTTYEMEKMFKRIQ
ncbi:MULTISPECIES: DNA mismatch repair endonuclease MutL [unclassified Sporolactobacillus]|uniref:DNA mismatch repair endonuclease MutL n=1 Tax=unclassified Sporolactobacillus TaxID=2628533 RepID=UPI002367E0B0|nr:DNA mismatch repair endonuclease MutL [Sporolactobacillus sp. CQH2019]MDD9146979.1 DNA mismatch repair endonuclease MutL [Sporolactobacillus sp. CQH2019]